MPDGGGTPRLRPYGDAALLVDLGDAADEGVLRAVVAAAAALRDDPPPDLVDLVPAATTVLLRLRPGRATAAAAHVRRVLGAAPAAGGPGAAPAADDAAGTVVDVPVRYDGPDLEDAARALGTDVAGLVARHTDRPWVVAFTGFAPGFGYCVQEPGPDGSDGRSWDVPRLASPRTAVPPGSVGLAGPYSGVYPRASPGGWQLVGTTDVLLWDLERDPPALLAPGTRVRFRDAGRSAPAEAPLPAAVSGPDRGAPPVRALEVLAPGPGTTVQDLGRPGRAALGVGPSGAADRAAHRLAQRLVGNPEDAAGLEVVLGGLRVRARGALVVAVTGAPVPVRVDGVARATGEPLHLRDGAVLELGTAPEGVRAVVAVRGGVLVPPVLGSRSTDVLAGLGPAVPAAGDVLPVGDPAGARDVVCDLAPPLRVRRDGPVELRVVAGPRDGHVEGGAAALADRPWTVGQDVDRVGVRLAGQPLRRALDGEVPSEGVVRGALQVPPSGLPTLLLADHPVTGGYPVAATVVDADLDLAARLRPGDAVVLRLVPPPPT